MIRSIRCSCHVAFLILSCLLVAACDFGSSGTQGNLQFRDLTSTVPPDLLGRIDAPMAVGARLLIDVELEGGTQDADIASASSDDGSVFEVESFTVGRVVLQANGPGSAFLDVTTQTGVSDAIGIGVDDIADTQILLLPWNAFFKLPEILWPTGAAILQGGSVEVFAEHANAQGTVLTGYGAADWVLSESDAATLTPAESSDFATLRASDVLETLTVSTSAGGQLALDVIEESLVAELSFYNKTAESGPWEEGETMQVAQGSHLVHIAAYTDDGRYVVGAGSEPIVVTIPSDGQAIAVISIAPNPDDENEELNRVLTNGRAFFVDAKSQGETTMTVEWAGRTTTITIEVLPGETDTNDDDAAGGGAETDA